MRLYRGALLKNGKKVESAENMEAGLSKFINWLSKVCDETTGQVIMVRNKNLNSFYFKVSKILQETFFADYSRVSFKTCVLKLDYIQYY